MSNHFGQRATGHLVSRFSGAVSGNPDILAGERSLYRELRRELRAPLILGLSAMGLFFIVGGIWAATAPLSGAVIAAGIVSPENSRQTVQHLEGGIIREFKVREGQTVRAGDVLIVLENVRAKAEADARMSRFRMLAATEARLKAEHAGLETVEFQHSVLGDQMDPEVRTIIQVQRDQFGVRRESMASRAAILRQRIVQLKIQAQGFQRQLEGNREQSVYIAEEFSAVEDLFRKGLERKPRLLALQRERAKLFGSEGELVARIARIEEAIGETNLQIANLDIERMEEVDTRLAEIIAQRIELEMAMQTSLDRLRRTEIRAPIAGIVLELRYKTAGGVIGPGQPILDLVPLADDLVIEARVRPNDIDEVRNGNASHIIFPSFSQRNLKRIEGIVETVSPDALEDKRTGERYYSARVTVDRQLMKSVAPEISLSPGMPAEVFIATRERTVLEFLLQPFLMSLERAFREN